MGLELDCCFTFFEHENYSLITINYKFGRPEASAGYAVRNPLVVFCSEKLLGFWCNISNFSYQHMTSTCQHVRVLTAPAQVACILLRYKLQTFQLRVPRIPRGANGPFYRYGGHIELIQFKEYYRMPRGHEHISFVFSSSSRDIFLKVFLE